MLKSFVDTLFIMLCGTMIVLCSSVPMGSMNASPVRIGSGGLADVRPDEVRVIVIYADHVELSSPTNGQTARYASIMQAAASVGRDRCILLVAGRPEISHQRVMDCWDACRQRGLAVKLGLAKVIEQGRN